MAKQKTIKIPEPIHARLKHAADNSRPTPARIGDLASSLIADGLDRIETKTARKKK